ncbi:hypothetical protein [Phenylobacterium sp. J367]|uniref:hypothetical protein n=1 Tax=Phenylobacterium sp. J367 TaxID=2898435 RepID=UPI00215076A0|nr:hypothetical protein [Phenylobacterium sp. J367]MCR5879748.1 hypothetical protein [Phenylobacterium sp. J367]
MANLADNDRYDTYSRDAGRRDVGVTAFLWAAWAAAAVFWGFLLTTAYGIVQALGHPSDGLDAGEAGVAGIGWMTINMVGGLVILGGALAWGAYRYASRDRGLDPVTEASTHALYDIVERQGGDDLTSRSPEAREPFERDAFRSAERDMR